MILTRSTRRTVVDGSVLPGRHDVRPPAHLLVLGGDSSTAAL